jgi:tripartite ATP-independent transporter DctM subunit
MGTLTIASILFALLLVLLFGGVWIAISLAAVAWFGLQFFTNTPPDVNLFQSFWGSSASWTLAALPLFIWMGEILYRTKLSEEMFEGLAPWLGWLPGRLMHVNILGCAIFGTVSGSSAATCATIAKVALPELKRRGYDEKTCLGSLAAAGTLGILLPPSIIMVVYAVAAEVSIIKVFLAGFIPGFVLTALFSGYIIVWALLNPAKTPRQDVKYTLMEKLHKTRLLIPCTVLIVFVVWVMVIGWATATEAAAYGVLGALVIAWWSGGLDRASFAASLMGATRLSCMIMFILAGASFLSSCMAFTGIPRALIRLAAKLARSRPPDHQAMTSAPSTP